MHCGVDDESSDRMHASAAVVRDLALVVAVLDAGGLEAAGGSSNCCSAHIGVVGLDRVDACAWQNRSAR